MEAVERDYSDKGVSFYYAYKTLAHPEWNGYTTPYSLEERLLHIKEAQRTLGSRFTWLCDNFDNDLKHQMGNAPNSEWVIDEDNVIVRRRDWSDAAALRKDLEELVGPVGSPTRIEDLDLPTQPPPKAAASGVVPRLERSARMAALKIEPKPGLDGHPFYAKLRAEADRGLMQSGQGQLYLRFMLDPLYKVKWNNLVDPIEVQVHAPRGMAVSEILLKGPEVDQEGDIDPREFLLDLSGAKPGDTIELTARYFACNDEEGWCIPVEQSYVVHMERDRDGGSVIDNAMRRRMREMMGDDPRPNRNNRRQRPTQPPPPGGYNAIIGSWSMSSSFRGQEIPATMTLRVEGGALVGTWSSQGREMDLTSISFDGKTLSFTRSVGASELQFTGTIDNNTLDGQYTGSFGDIDSNGTRSDL